MSAITNIIHSAESTYHEDVGLGESWQFGDGVQEIFRTLVPEHSYVLIKKDNAFKVVVNDEHDNESLLDLKLVNNCIVVIMDADKCISLKHICSKFKLPDGRYFMSGMRAKIWVDTHIKDNSLNPILHNLFSACKNKDIETAQKLADEFQISFKYLAEKNVIILYE